MAKGKPVNFLIVDDIAATRELLRGLIQSVLAQFSFPIEASLYQTENAKQTMALCTKRDMHLIFLDIELPDGNGLEVLKQIKANKPDTAVVMVSGDSSIASVKDAIESGIQGYIVKPFNFVQIQEQIVKFCKTSL